MPKKRTLKLKQFQGSTSTAKRPSAGQDGGDSPTSSVNERLNQLRTADSIDATQRKREIAELLAQKSTLPPELRSLLNIPESAAPKPKPGFRIRNRETMRTPGPAAPKSWLGLPEWWPISSARGGGKRKAKRPVGDVCQRNRPGELFRFAHMVEGGEKPKGLMHIAMKQLAEQWHLLDEEDFPVLTNIPLRLRLRLISYLGVYGPPIDTTALKALTAGSDPLELLDLGGLAGHPPLTLKKLTRLLESEKVVLSQSASNDILESWDAEETLESSLSSLAITSRFSHLTQLSLSDPPPSVSWRELLSLSRHLPQLTHLSLAYWPRPTLTPHLATATVASGNSPAVSAGGTHMYSGLDLDYSEAASLLRQLSSNLLCLQWLDLEGCAEWMPALAVLAAASSDIDHNRERDDWGTRPPVITMFTDTWKNVKYIRCAQGWLPSSAEVVSGLTGSFDPEIRTGLLKYLRASRASSESLATDVYEVEKRKAWIWIEQETKLRYAARRINTIRRARSERPVTFDFGWVREAVK
ncbi:hypothetical protein B0A50_07896 [Salinomyces thailandicus]|uniref:Tafazzin n=1 Tax=Salinomyces thailandicus TaxID=706561 RepID=A0A4U0TLL4_9PEZI|nr:hypothetical protein B0A50_07896 [Salinomyces thailandica]